jgi:polysaccharide biosynthesis transport protein
METPVTAITPVPPQSLEPVDRARLVEDPSHSFGAPSGGLLEYWRIIQRRRATVIVVACLGLLAGLFYTLPQTPVYQAHAVLEIQSLNSEFMYGKELTATANTDYDPGINIQTQVRVLQSRALIDRVVRKLGLEKKDLVSRPTRLDAWRKALKLAPAEPPSRDAVIANAAGGLQIKTQENTRLIEIYSDSTNPQMAAEFVNTLTDEFIAQNHEARYQAIQETGDWLKKQMEGLKIELERNEEDAQGYASQKGLAFTDDKDSVADQRVKHFQQALSSAQTERINRQSRYQNVQRIPVASLAEVLDDPSIREIDAKLLDLRTQKATLLLTYTAEYPKVQRLQEQIDALEPILEQKRAAILNRLRSDYEDASDREKLLKAEYDAAVQSVAEQADRVSHYRILQRESETTRQIYDTMLQRVKEAGVASALESSNIRIVDRAVPPAVPYKPRLSQNSLIGLISGLFAGVFLVVFLDRVDRSIQEPGDAAFFLGVPELGVIPSAVSLPNESRGLFLFAGGSGPSESPSLVTSGRTHSIMAESIRTVLTSIMFASPDAVRPQVIVVSSAAPAEGKSTLVANLAVMLAEINQRVLLVDADLRRPSLHRFFELENDRGVADVLRAGDPAAFIRPTAIPNLSVLLSGRPQSGNPTLLYSDRLGSMLNSLRKGFDAVLIDTPPMLTMADARVVGRCADAVILVARANRTSRQALRDACQRFIDDGANVLGAVLNDWNPSKSSRYGYSRYYQRYKHYYAPTNE